MGNRRRKQSAPSGPPRLVSASAARYRKSPLQQKRRMGRLWWISVSHAE